jgi:ABC-type transporter Mla subunit MlaD
MAPILSPDAASIRSARSARLSIYFTLAALLGTSLYLGWKEDWFTPVVRFYFQARSSKSLSKGIAVRLSGFKIGQVGRVDLQEDRTVRVELEVFKRYLYLIKSDCVVHVQAGIPIGDASVEIVGGSGRADAPEPGARLRFVEDPQPMDQIAQFLGRLDPLVDSLNGLFKQASQTQAELQVSLRNLSDTTARIQAWTPGFLARSDETMASFNRAGSLATDFLAPMNNPNGDLQASLRDLREASAEFHSALPPILTDLKALTSSLRASAQSIEPAVNRMAPQLPPLVEESRRTAANAGQVVDAIKDMSLIRKKVDQTPPEPVLPTTPP